MNRYKAAGIQLDPEYGIGRHQLMDLLFMIDDDSYEIISFDADESICYFIFSFNYFEKHIDGENLNRFKEMFIKISNNIEDESPSNRCEYDGDLIYEFDGEPIYFGY